jgi:FkbM family methyltransferase
MFNRIFFEMYLRNLFGKNQEPEISKLVHLISRNSVVIDVGANRGTYSFPISRKLRKPGHLYSFEPIPKLYNYLEKGLGGRDTVKVYSFACGDRQGVKRIRMPINNGELGMGSASFVNSFKDFETIIVKIISIDSLNISKVHFIKIDVEGFETLVLRGAIKTIERNRPVILVEIDWNMGNNYFPELKKIIEKLDYVVLALTGGKMIKVTLPEFNSRILNFHKTGYRNNFFLVPREEYFSTKESLSRKNYFNTLKKLILIN